jgi:aconitate hydratase
LDGTETYDILGLETGEVQPRQTVPVVIHKTNGETKEVQTTLRIDTPIEVEYYKNGGILPFVLRQLLNERS